MRIMMGLAMFGVFMSVSVSRGQDSPWFDSFYTYRIQMELSEPVSGDVEIGMTPARIIELVKPISIDIFTEDTLAFENAILVDPATNLIVGGFKLQKAGDEIAIDGDFTNWQQQRPSPWGVQLPGYGKVDTVTSGNLSFGAMQVSFAERVNTKLSQTLDLIPGDLYLLEKNLLTSPTGEPITVTLQDRSKELFAEVPHSYYNKMPDAGTWARQFVLYRPERAATELELGFSFVDAGSVGGIKVSPVKWVLRANIPKIAKSLDLYLVATAGHRLTHVTEEPVAGTQKRAAVAKSSADMISTNANGYYFDAGDGIRAWHMPEYLPLRAETMAASRPLEPNEVPVKARLCRGGQSTIVIAIETGTPSAQFSNIVSDLPVTVQVNRIAPIPVFDNFFPVGKQVETRFDALVDVAFAQMPPNMQGLHPLAITLNVPTDGTPGIYRGTVAFTVQSQEPMAKNIEVPIELTILPPVIKPMRHFGVMFGSGQLTAEYKVSDNTGFISDSFCVARFHGYHDDGIGDSWISRLSRPDRDQPGKLLVRELGKKYGNRLIDFDILPQLPALFYNYSYRITDRGPGKAPLLDQWDFTEFDKAIDELVIKRDAPLFCIWHTNGHQMSSFDLRDGTVYTILPHKDGEPRIQLPRDEFVSLVADYFESMAAHLATTGALDRAMVLVDESDETTYQIIYDIAMAMRARPNAKKIRFGHTTYKTGAYTETLPDGKLVMGEVLDLPMPINDEHFNYFEPDWARRLTRSGKQDWVYYVESDHLNLDNAGLSTVITPLKLRPYGVKGWYCWAAYCWSMPYGDQNLKGSEYWHGPAVNPWLNPYYHHGHGMLSFFYPPDPRGPSDVPNDTIIPSYRLALIQKGIQDYALLDVLQKGVDDAGRPIAVNKAKLQEATDALQRLWTKNTVQWYLSYDSYRAFSQALNDAIQEN